MIEDLDPRDAEAVAALDADLFGDRAYSPAAWAQEAASQGADRRYVVLREAGAGPVIGYGGILRTGSDADVLTVGVARTEQGRGLGRTVLEELVRTACGWRCLAVFLEVEQGNTAAAALYRSLGFEDVGVRRHYYGNERHAVVMRRRLREPMGSLPLTEEVP